MQTKDFNVLSLTEKSKLIFGEGKLIAINEDNKFQKIFYYKYNNIKVDVIYDKVHNSLLDIIAWETEADRIDFLKMPAESLNTTQDLS